MSARPSLWGFLALVAALSACGGGDGGGGGGGGTGVGSVTVTLGGPARFDATIYEGQSVPTLVVPFTLSGDVASLNGRTVHVYLVIPDTRLFGATPTLYVAPDGRSGNVQVGGSIAASGSAGTYTNTATARVCLDPACASALRVVNPDIPYSITVKQGVRVEGVALRTTFGAAPAPIRVPIGLPDGVRSWTVKPGNGGVSFQTVRADPAPDGSAALVVSPVALFLPGTSTEAIRVEAVTAEGQTLGRYFEATYSTTTSDVPYAFRIPSVHVTVPSGYAFLTDPVRADALFPGDDGDRFDYLGATYTWPAAADGMSLRDRWLYLYLPVEEGSPRWPTMRYGIEVETQSCMTGTCLPAGRYEAQLHFRYTPASGPAVDQDYPVTLDIAP